MEPTIIMSEQFKEALEKELQTIEDVIDNFHYLENNFELDDYKRYLYDLQRLKEWMITE